MSRGALQGGRELRLRVRHKKPKRLLRSWYNLLGHEHSGANGSDVEEVRKDVKHRFGSYDQKELLAKQSPTCAPASPDNTSRTRLNGGIGHAASVEKMLNGRCHSYRAESSNGKEAIHSFEDDDASTGDSDLMCSVCSKGDSDPPNEIVICDTCNKGFHQACHTPKISDQVLLPNIPWHCRNCVPVGSVRKSAKNYRNGARVQMFKLGFPYNMKSLQWDPQHRINTRNCYCYCGGPGEWNKKMLQCRLCQQWFHEACIQGLETPLLYGDRFYFFSCSVCNNGPEVVKRMQLSWMDITHLTLYNLFMEHHKKYYDLEDEILPYLNSIWLALQLPSDIFRCSMRERRSNIQESLYGDKNRFKSGREVKKRNSLWCLRSREAPPTAGETVPPRESRNNLVAPPRESSKTHGSQVHRKGVTKGAIALPDQENGQKIKKKKLHSQGKSNVTDGKVVPRKLPKLPNGICSKRPPKLNGLLCDSAEDSGSIKPSRGVVQSFLDTFIPAPHDFEDGNHPFRDEELFPPLPPPPKRLGRPPKLKPLIKKCSPPPPNQRPPRFAGKLPRDCFSMPRRNRSSDSDSDSTSGSSTSTVASSSSSGDNSSSTQVCEDVDKGSPRWKGTLRSGEKCDLLKGPFSVLAKRVGADGKAQYLVEWDGSGSRT